MNQRRLLVLALGTALACNPALLRAQTSSASTRRVGVLVPGTKARDDVLLKPFFDQMHQLGWLEGQTIAYDRVYGDDQIETLPRLAAELVARKPELIYAPPTPAALAAKRATQTIPVVFGAVTDPVGIGLVTTLARPGGNVTGICFTESLAPKRLELLRQILPGVKRVGLLGNVNDTATRLEHQALAPVAASLGVTVIVADATNPIEFDAAIARLIADRVDVIFAGQSTLSTSLRVRLIELASQKRLPVVGGLPILAEAGAFFSYGPPLADSLRRSALLVDKILKGAKPADLPVEQPTLFELVVNLKTAKVLGITIPPSILLRADRVIE